MSAEDGSGIDCEVSIKEVAQAGQQWPLLRKSYTHSTHRSRTPADTLAAYQHFMPRLGITRLANITGLDCIGIPVFVAVRPMSRGLATAQGKGLDLPSAKASALMEAMETWHAERFEAITRVDTYAELSREGTAIDVTGLRRRPGRKLPRLQPVTWALGYELVTGERRWVPWEAVSCDFSSIIVRQSIFLQTTNGLASGNHVLEAVVHALCEAIERDAITIHNHSTHAYKKETQVNLESIEDARCRSVLQTLHDAGIHVVVRDCTSDIGVPVLSASIVDAPSSKRWRSRGVFRGFGCHPSRNIALLRALTEAIQSRVTYISGSRDDLFVERFSALQRMEDDGILTQYVRSGGTRSFAEMPNLEHSTFNGDLNYIIARLKEVGLEEAAVFDLTRPDIGVPVVKLIVPGLENNIQNDRSCQPGPRVLRARLESA